MDWLKKVEDIRLAPYDDQTGKPITSWVKGATIGYGHLIGKNEWKLYKGGITSAQAESILRADLAPFIGAVNYHVTASISQNQFDALTILAFNIGLGAKNVDGFTNSSALKLINNPSAKTPYSSLEGAWKAWNKSQGTVSNGLINRRSAEWDMYDTGVYRTW